MLGATMPEAAIYKYCKAVLSKNKIRVTEELEPTTPTGDVGFPKDHNKLMLRRGITVAADLLHTIATLLARKIVSHYDLADHNDLCLRRLMHST
jgi:hypothetical protein